MELSVYIAPVGFEYKRVLAGINYKPSNIIYLLNSEITNPNLKETQLIQVSEGFTSSLMANLEKSSTYQVLTRECSFVDYKTIILELSLIFKEIFDKEKKGDIIKSININIGTATKLFVAATMYLSSFFLEKVNIFYIRANKYTINLLLDEERSKEEIRDIFIKDGMTYSEGDYDDYSFVDIPVAPTELCHIHAKNILIHLYKLGGEVRNWIKLQDILKSIGEKDSKSVKMKYRYHFRFLIERNLIEEYKHGRMKTYKLTERGEILSIIIANLEDTIEFKE